MKAGWREKHLGDVCTLQRGFDLPVQNRIKGRFPIVSSSGVIDAHYEGITQAPGVVTGRSGSIGKVFFIEDDFWPLNTVLYVKDFHGNAPKFVFHLLNWIDLSRFAGGVGVPTLNRNNVHCEIVSIPESIDEQQRIVAILDEAFESIATAKANAEQNLKNARELFDSYLQSVFTQRGEGWVEKRLGELAESISTGPFGTMLHKSDYVSEGIPLVNPMNIINSQIVPSEKMMVSEETQKRLSTYMLKIGDVVVGRRGELGRCALVTDNEEGWLCGTGSFFIRLNPQLIERKLFVSIFSSSSHKQKLEELSIGTTMSNLNHSILNNLVFYLPPLPVQRSIVARLDALFAETQRLESIYQQKIAALDELKQSLLQRAFAGEL